MKISNLYYLKNIYNSFKIKEKKILNYSEYYYLQKSVIELNNINELKKIFGWKLSPILEDPEIFNYSNIEDVNERRIRDSETIATVVKNINPSICLDIGTAAGHSAALISQNAPNAKVFTVNISQEELKLGKGGKLTTIALDKDNIGKYYRSRNLNNIIQIYADTKYWKPDIGTIDFAFIDGCHDSNYVYNDTVKIINNMKKESFIIWHDFNLNLVNKYDWIKSVSKGIEKLYYSGILKGRIFHIRDSWSGIYKV